ncbi:MAG: TIGR00266 family protein [Cyanobacteriota bacterium]
MADQIDYQLIGDDMQAVIITLDPGETVMAEAGAMMFMTNEVQMETRASTKEGNGIGGALLGGLKRIVTGESFFITAFKCVGNQKGKVAFAAPYPGKIIPVDLSKSPILCQKDAYLCSAWGVDINIKFAKRIGAGFFGGEGFILQELKGDGWAFIHAGGTILKKTLAHGEKLKVDTGCLVAFQPTVTYDIEFVGGVKTALFGGEGLFFATLTGPGDTYLQTMPFSRMADRIISASRMPVGEVQRGSSVSGILGDIISGG